MNRTEFVTALVAATALPASAAIGAQIEIKRDASGLLAPFTVSIALRNATSRPVALDFPTADIYRIDVQREDRTIWSTASGHKPLQIARRVDLAPGLTRLASQIIDGTTDDRRAYAPGSYVVHVALLGTTIATSIDKPIAFDPPLTIAAARAGGSAAVVTIAGVPHTDAGVAELRDASGSIRLSRPLALRAAGTYIVRGYLDAQGNDTVFAVGRSAPAFDNVTDVRPASPT